MNGRELIQEGLQDEKDGAAYWQKILDEVDEEYKPQVKQAIKDEQGHYKLLKKIKISEPKEEPEEECEPENLEEAKYEVHGKDWCFECRFCEYFTPVSHTCIKFNQGVDADGCCTEFEYNGEENEDDGSSDK